MCGGLPILELETSGETTVFKFTVIKKSLK